MSDTNTFPGLNLQVSGTGMFGSPSVSASIAPSDPEPLKPKATKGKRPNRYAGDCRHCGARVEAEAGYLGKVDGKWTVEHVEGECSEAPAPAPAPKSKRHNRYAGSCEHCGRTVPAGHGLLDRSDEGAWIVTHDGPCPSDFPFPEGRYAVDTDEGHLAFYHCTDGQVYVLASDNEHLLAPRAAEGVVAKIEVDPTAALARYGQEFTVCGLCNRGLTDEVSRERGIGPVCWRKMGEVF